MKNKLDDLVNALFAQLERFDDEEVCKDEESIEREIKKTKAITDLSERIIEVNKLQLDAYELALEHNIGGNELPPNWGIRAKRIAIQ